MKHNRSWHISLSFAFFVFLVLSLGAPSRWALENQTGGLKVEGSRPYSKNLEELRTRFNRDKGRVRLVTLLSPT